MKIERIDVRRYDLSLKEPFRIALGTMTSSSNILVKIFSEEHFGIGEGSPTLMITGDNQEGCLSFIESISPLLIGEELNLEVLYEKINSFRGMPAAKAALDIALYDLIGKQQSKPVYKLLGGYREKIETDITIGIDTPEEVRKKALEAISRGYRILKIKVEGDVERDFKRIEAISDLEVRIRIDANQGFTPKTAVRFIRRVREFDVEFIEQPVPYWDIDGLRYVKERSDIPIIADESVHSARDALNVVKCDAVDGINIKLMKCGGISDAVRIVHIAESAGIPCMVGCMLESRISLTAAAHLALAFKNIKYVDLDSHLFLKEDPVVGGMEIVEGMMTLPEKPGLGIAELNMGEKH
ncbi:L-alanine-DL-glutamate epimerase and related enzymes of enolase superfamily [Archaeoglobus sulfaticallidus PM70-1]|uniref:L-alanine-DL-glutamate epimerase and related enzymes of enolase superfamily n=2 Tax=Archaeoglobus TaxID=2233 RepID=N0BIA6_9EURY|nr:L-alanine-DL-glutamate epimerase and related enzymes of enolase superfamily [Archaeoglobus sulfaticallidus PM70-1]